MIPFRNPKMGWFIGKGLRETIQLDAVGGAQILNNFLLLSRTHLTTTFPSFSEHCFTRGAICPFFTTIGDVFFMNQKMS